MKHSIWMRLALIILSVSMVLSFAACKPAGNDETTGKETEQKTEVDTTVETEATTDDAEVTTEEKTPETTEAKPEETTGKKPVETTEKKPVETTEKKDEPVAEPDPLKVYIAPSKLAGASVNAGRLEAGKLSADGSYVTYTNKADGGDGYVLMYSGGAVVSGQYLVIKYRYSTENQTTATNIEIFASTVNGGPTGGDNTRLPAKADGEWHIAVVDMSAAKSAEKFPAGADGKYTVKYARFDILDGSHKVGDKVDVAYAGITDDLSEVVALAKKEGAKTFDLSKASNKAETIYTSTGTTTPTVEDVVNVYVAPDKMTGASVNANRISGKELSADGKYITFTANGTGGDGYALLYSGGATVSGQYIVFKYRYHAENAYAQTYIEIFTSCTNGGATGGDNIRVEAVADGEWHVAVADVSTLNTKFVANDDGAYIAKYARFDIFDGGSTGEGDKIDIAYIGYADSIDNILKANKDVKKIYYKLGNDVALKYTLYTSTGTTDPAITDVANKYFDAAYIAGKAPSGTNIGTVTLAEDGTYVSIYGKGASDGFFMVFSGNTDVTGQYVVMKYRYPTTNAEGYKPANRSLFSGNVYGGPTGDDTSNTFPVVADGEWHMTVFNLAAHLKDTVFVANEDGTYTVKYLRFDIADGLPADCCIDIQYIALTDDNGLNNMIAVAKGEGLETVTARLDSTTGTQTYYTATGTTEPPVEDETGTGDETETETDVVVDPEDPDQDVDYEVPYYKFSTEKIQGVQKVNGGTNSVAYFAEDVNAFSNGKVTVTGWMMAWDGVEKYQYSFDGGNNWIDVPANQYGNITRNDLVNHIGENESAVLATNFKKNGIYSLSIPVEEYHNKNISITICAILTGGHRVEFLQLLNVKVAHAPDENNVVDNGDGTHTWYCAVEGCGAVAKVENHTAGPVSYNDAEKAYYAYCSKCPGVPVDKIGPFNVMWDAEALSGIASSGAKPVLSQDKTYVSYTGDGTTKENYITLFSSDNATLVTGQYLIMMYKTNLSDSHYSKGAQIYSSTVTATAGETGSNTNSYYFNYNTDEQWHIGVFDLAQNNANGYKDEGNGYIPKLLRLDIFNPSSGDVVALASGQYINIAFIAICDSMTAAKNYIVGNEYVDACDHPYLSDEYGYDLSKHWHSCLLCNTPIAEEHVIGSSVPNANGTYDQTCALCPVEGLASTINLLLTPEQLMKNINSNSIAVGNKATLSEDGTYVTVKSNSKKTAADNANDDFYFFPFYNTSNTSIVTGKYAIVKYRATAGELNAASSEWRLHATTTTGLDGDTNIAGKQIIFDNGWNIAIYDLTGSYGGASKFAESTHNGVEGYYLTIFRLGYGAKSGTSVDIAFIGFCDDLEKFITIANDNETAAHTCTLGASTPVEGGVQHTATCVICKKVTAENHIYSDVQFNTSTKQYDRTCTKCGHVISSPLNVYYEGGAVADKIIANGGALGIYTEGEKMPQASQDGTYSTVTFEPVNLYFYPWKQAPISLTTGQYFVMKYRMAEGTSGDSTFTMYTSTIRAGAVGEKESIRSTPLYDDGQWHVVVVDLSAAEEFNVNADGVYKAGHVRLGFPCSADGKTMDIAYFGIVDDLANLANVIDKTELGTEAGKTQHDHYLVPVTGEGVPAHTSKCMICGEIQTVDHTWATSDGYNYICSENCGATYTFTAGSAPTVYADTAKLASKYSGTSILTDTDGAPYTKFVSAGDYYSVLYSCSSISDANMITGKYMVVKYRVPEGSTANAMLVWTDTTRTGANGTYSNRGEFSLTKDGQWHIEVIDVSKLSAAGATEFVPDADGNYRAGYLRVHPTGSGTTAGRVVHVQYIAMFETIEDAAAFDSELDYMYYRDVVAGHRYGIQSNGKLVITTEKFDSFGNNTTTPAELDNGFKYVNIKSAAASDEQSKTLVGSSTATSLTLGSKFIGILYQAPAKVTVGGESVTNNLGKTSFLGNCTQNKISGPGDGHVATNAYEYNADGKWHMMIINVIGIGTLDNPLYALRWDYFDSARLAGGELNVANIGFYASEAEAMAMYKKYVEKYNLVCGHDSYSWKYVDNDKDATDTLYEVAVCNVCNTEIAGSLRVAKFRAHTDFYWVNGNQSANVARDIFATSSVDERTYTLAEGTVVTKVGIGAWAGASNTYLKEAYYRVLDKDGNILISWRKIGNISVSNNAAVIKELNKTIGEYGFINANAVSIYNMTVDFSKIDTTEFPSKTDLVVEYAFVPDGVDAGAYDRYMLAFRIANIDLVAAE